MNLKELCKVNYRGQLEGAGMDVAEIDKKLRDEDGIFEKCEEFTVAKGGILYLKNEKVAYVYYIYVEQISRDQGLGTFILRQFEKEMEIEGIKKIQLNVYDHNTVAKKLYRDYTTIQSQLEKQL